MIGYHFTISLAPKSCAAMVYQFWWYPCFKPHGTGPHYYNGGRVQEGGFYFLIQSIFFLFFFRAVTFAAYWGFLGGLAGCAEHDWIFEKSWSVLRCCFYWYYVCFMKIRKTKFSVFGVSSVSIRDFSQKKPLPDWLCCLPTGRTAQTMCSRRRC